MLDAAPRQLHICILLAFPSCGFCSLLLLVLTQKIPLRVIAFTPVDADAVTYAERSFIRQLTCADLGGVQCAGHDDKGAVSALSGLRTETLAEGKQFSEFRFSHDGHDALIIFWSFRAESIRPLCLQPMRQIAAGDDRDRPAQLPRCFLDALAQPVMHRKR